MIATITRWKFRFTDRELAEEVAGQQEREHPGDARR